MPASLNLTALPAVSGSFLRRHNSDRASIRRITINAAAAPAMIESPRPPASLYEVLRVEQDALPTEIKSAYRSLAKLYHPDAAVGRRSESDGGGFIEIRNAYGTLLDPSARAMYDLSLTAASGGRHRRFSTPLSMNRNSGFYHSRRWETDQCCRVTELRLTHKEDCELVNKKEEKKKEKEVGKISW